MQFTTRATTFTFSILGYQFPHLTTQPYDSNWLLIHLQLAGPRGVWQHTDPCLLTYEIRFLADWLDQLAVGNFEKPNRNFLEPVLTFTVVARPPRPCLRIFFASATRPPWAAPNKAYRVEFDLATLPLAEAATDLRQQLARYPQRAAK